MDSKSKESNLDASSVIPSSKVSLPISSLSTSNPTTAEASTSQPVVSGSNLTKKHIIRKIIPLDPKKLQQAGLDRKIAEALSKQKSQQSISQPNQKVDVGPSSFQQKQTTEANNLQVSRPTSQPSPAKNIENKTVLNKLTPPKITITGPEALTEQEKQNLANLNPQQRLVHVKNLLNKKLLEKKSKEMNDNSKTNELLKTPQAIGDRTQHKLHTKVTKEKPAVKHVYDVLKEPISIPTPSLQDQPQPKLQTKTSKDGTSLNVLMPSSRTARPTKTKTPQKSPQDIARKLVFQTNTATKTSLESTSSKRSVTEVIAKPSHPDDEEFLNCLNKDIDVIPKASITSVNMQQHYKKPKQYVKKSKPVVQDLPAKHSVAMTCKSKEPQNFQAVYMKQQKIVKEPKMSLNAVITQMKLPKLQRLDFTEVSPLKEPFPTANVPSETPLPAIESFKKPYPLANTTYYNLQQNPALPTDYILTSYETSLFSQQSTPMPLANVNSDKAATATNCLVVLENKILSQDEMIDLTELRLSSNTPRFIHPHRPIPEVVIKQEHPDDYQATDASSLASSFTMAVPGITSTQVIKSQNDEKPPMGVSPISNKQKKIIINAQKLQLPPEQLADLARRIKQKTTTNKTKTKQDTKQSAGKYQNAAITDSKVFNKKSPVKNTNFVLPHHADVVAQTPPYVMPQDFVLPHNQMYGRIYNQDHDYYNEQNYFLSGQTNVDTINASLIETNVQQASSAGSLLYNYFDNAPDTSPKFDMSKDSLGSQDYAKSAVEIVDEPIETEDSFSAVDFIAALDNTSTELSPEELNLSASCKFNQSFSQVAITSPEKSMKSVIQTNTNKNLLKSTIVIESSKGQETILTNKSPDKNDLEKVKEKIKIYHELNKQKSTNKTTKFKSPSKVQPDKNTDDAQTRYCNDPKLYDNTNVCDMDIEELPQEQRCYIPERQTERKLSPVAASEAVITTVAGESVTKTTVCTAAVKPATVLQPPLEPSTIVDSIDGKETKDRLETPTTENTIMNIKHVSDDFVTTKTKEQTGKEQLEIQSQTYNTAETATEQKLEALSTQIPQKTTTTTKLLSETEISQNDERIANNAIASKRVSKFKKGKINLVPRNKPSTAVDKKTADDKDFAESRDVQGPEKSDEKKSDSKKIDEKKTDEMKTDCKIKVYLELRDQAFTSHGENTDTKIDDDKDLKSNATESSAENKTECNQVADQSQNKLLDISQHTVEGNKEETSKLSKHTHESERRDKTKQQKQPTKTNLITEKPQIVATVLKPEAAEKDVIDIPKASIKTSSSTPTIKPHEDLTAKTKTIKVSTEPLQSLAKEADVSETVAMKTKNMEETYNPQAVEKVAIKGKSVSENSVAEATNHNSIKKSGVLQATSGHISTEQFTTKGEDKVVTVSQQTSRNCSADDLQNDAESGSTSQKSSIMETNPAKESSVDLESVNNLSPQFLLSNTLMRSVEKLQEPRAENANFTFTEDLKVKDSTAETQCNKSLTVAKIEDEEQNAFGLPKAITGRMKVLQEPKKTSKVFDSAKTATEVDKFNEEKCFNSLVAENKEEPKHFTRLKKLVSQSEDEISDTKTFQPKMGIPKSKTLQQYPAKSAEQKNVQNDEKPLKMFKIEKTEKTEMPQTSQQKTEMLEDLNQNSQAILQTMKSARISLVDIVKHSPLEQTNEPPILPFKKAPSDIKHNVTNVSGITNLLQQLKKGQRKDIEKEQTMQDPTKPVRETRQSLTKKEEHGTSKCSRRSSSRTSESLTAALPPKINRKRLSLRPLISDDDLEFLPENAEIKFNLTKSKQKEEEKKKSSTETRRASLYSSTLPKRNRYYSQTLETDVTITFDNLKAKTDLKKNAQNLAAEESGHDSTQDSSFATPIKQRKKLRKTVQDIKKSQKDMSDTDSEDFQRDYDSIVRDCEESNEFLGFEDSPAIHSGFGNLQQNASDTEHESKAKYGGLKNWLTTGKAISPTPDNATSRKRLRQNTASPVTPTFETKQQTRLKKRWNLCSKNAHEETDITDDTSPADDEEEISDEIPLKKKLKRGIKNVIDSNKNAIDSKKIKLNESSFKTPAIVRSCDADDTEQAKEKAQESQQLNKKHLEEDIAKISKPADVNRVTRNATRNSPQLHKELSKDQHKSEKSPSDNESEDYKHRKSKEAAKYSKKENKNDNERIVESKRSSSSRPDKAQPSETTVTFSDGQTAGDVDSICASDIEIKQMVSEKPTDAEEKPLNRSEPQRGKRSRISKANETEKDSCSSLKQQETPVKKTATQKDKSLKEVAVDKPKKSAEKTCSTPKRKRKTGQTKQNDSFHDDSPLSSYKKRPFKDIDDLDSNSLPTPLDITNVSYTQNLNTTTECDSNSLEPPVDKTLEADNSMNDTKPQNKRGRQRNYESNFNPRLLLVTKREQLDSGEILTETSTGTGPIQCGLCLTRTQSSQWTSHLAKHYGVGWQVGEQKLSIDSRTVVLNTITNYMKKSKCTGLACRMCQKVLRSALGILTHIEQCGNQERLDCEFCKKNYAKNSLVIHLRSCKVRCALEAETSVKDNQSENIDTPEEIVGNSGRLKRHSTIKAENKLKVLGKELENLGDADKPKIDPKLYIKYVPCLESNFTEKWSKEIETDGRASCPKDRCKFTGTALSELSEHVKTCKHMKSGYICNFCRKAFKTENEAIGHISANHQKGRKRRKSDDSDCDMNTELESSSDEAESSEGVDENESTDGSENEVDNLVEESDKRRGKNTSKIVKLRYSRHSMAENRKEVFDGRSKDLNREVLKKWNNFTKSNYSCEPLYNEFTPQHAVLNHLDYDRYLPTQTVSMKFNFTAKKKLIETVGLPEKDVKWSELKRFETINNKSHTYCFLGAPIKICSWLPLPADVNEQFLAVVYRQEMFKYVKFKQPKQHHNIVLLFKVTQKSTVPALSPHYGFVVNDGPIHHLSFLPSGGYDKSNNRLGLVAVATVTSCIKVYSLPLSVDTDNCNGPEPIRLIDVKSSFQLNLEASHQNEGDTRQQGLLNCQCLQISWSEFSGHHHIFAGFSNGFVGIWNIKNNPQENLNRFIIDDIVTYTPLNYFYLGEKCTKCLALHYDTLGPRWLVASTVYRKIIVFDIKNLTNPIVYKEDVLKNILLSMDWCPIWETFLISYDDALQNIGNGVIAVNPTNVMFQHAKLDSATTGVSQAHYTPVTNMCVTALNNGEIVFLDTKELHYENCLSKKTFERRSFYALDVKRLDGEALVRLPKGNKQNDNAEIPSDWVMHDHNYKDKYGLMFAPLMRLDDKFKKAYVSEKRIPPPNIIPFMRITALRCNINQQGKHLVAAGYENGFLRIMYFNKEKAFSY